MNSSRSAFKVIDPFHLGAKVFILRKRIISQGAEKGQML